MMHERWDAPKPFEKDPFPTLHATGFGVASLMVVSAEVENAVDHQCDEFLIEGPPPFPCLTYGSWNGNYHVAQQPRAQAQGLRQTGFPRGKRQDVRRAILAPKLAIESAHTPIGNKCQTKVRRRLPHMREHGLHQSPDSSLAELHGSNLILEENRH
jgi:hypothetical protein